MSKNYTFILNSKEYKFKFNLKLFSKLGDTLSEKLINNGKYLIQSKVSNENFQTFLDFLNEKIKYPEINVDNYFDYLQLSEEFNNILSHYLSSQEFDNIRNISILKNAKTIEVIDKGIIEEYIAKHLDYYLEFFSSDMSQIPTTTLYNIFHHKNRILCNHERAYQFINDNNSKNIFILLKTLDASKISEESFNESFSKKNKHYGFSPEFSLSFISELKNQMKDVMMHQMHMMEQMKSFFDQEIGLFNKNYDSLAKKLDDTQNDIKNLSQKVESIENEVKVIRKDVDKIIEENQDSKINIENLSQKVEKIENEVKKIPLVIDHNYGIIQWNYQTTDKRMWRKCF